MFKGSADCGTSCGLSPASSNRVDNNLRLIASNCNDIDLMVGGDLPGDELVFKGSADCGTSCGLSPASSNRVDNNLRLIASNCNDIDLMVGGGLTWR